MPPSLSVSSQSGPPICTSFLAFKNLRALKGPQIQFSHISMHRPYRDLQKLKFSCLYLILFSHKVVPQKASVRGGGGGGGSGLGPIPGIKTKKISGIKQKFFFTFFSLQLINIRGGNFS